MASSTLEEVEIAESSSLTSIECKPCRRSKNSPSMILPHQKYKISYFVLFDVFTAIFHVQLINLDLVITKLIRRDNKADGSGNGQYGFESNVKTSNPTWVG